VLLWSGCRHHVGEVILTHVFDDLHIEASKSPDVSLFTRFRKHFNLLQSTSDEKFQRVLSSFDSSPIDETAHNFIRTCQASVLNLAQSQILLQRDDHLEFIQLCLLFLNGDTAGKTVKFKRPGALHKAR